MEMVAYVPKETKIFNAVAATDDGGFEKAAVADLVVFSKTELLTTVKAEGQSAVAAA